MLGFSQFLFTLGDLFLVITVRYLFQFPLVLDHFLLVLINLFLTCISQTGIATGSASFRQCTFQPSDPALVIMLLRKVDFMLDRLLFLLAQRNRLAKGRQSQQACAKNNAIFHSGRNLPLRGYRVPETGMSLLTASKA